MRSVAVLVLAAATAVAAKGNYTTSLNMTVTPDSVTESDKITFCKAQKNTCFLLCNKDTEQNTCEESDLTYDCLCNSNGSAPGLEYYTQTMPTFICQELFSQCIEQNLQDARAQQACKDDIQSLCGTLDPTKADVTNGDGSGSDDSETSSGTAAPTKDPESSPTDAAVTTTTSDGFAAPTLAPAGNGVAAIAAIGVLAYLV